MPDTLPPFDPPYASMHATDDGTRYIQTLADGTTRPVSAAAFGAEWSFASRSTGSAAAGADSKPSGAASNRFYLNVPFAEKDEAKALGARWDAAKKKWYAPQGVDAGKFERWLPKA